MNTTKEFFDTTGSEIVNRISSSAGLAQFACDRAKFEGWLKVELISILLEKDILARPEVNSVDIVSGRLGIELKTINTNYRMIGAENKGKPITTNIESVISDFHKLRNRDFDHKAVVFVGFPVDDAHTNWLLHTRKITSLTAAHYKLTFKFSNGLPGVIYYIDVV